MHLPRWCPCDQGWQRRSFRGALSGVRRSGAKAVDSSPKCRDGENHGIEPLMIPQLREVETDRSRFSVAVAHDGLHQPLKSFRQRGLQRQRRPRRQQGLHGQCRFLDTACRAAPPVDHRVSVRHPNRHRRAGPTPARPSPVARPPFRQRPVRGRPAGRARSRTPGSLPEDGPGCQTISGTQLPSGSLVFFQILPAAPHGALNAPRLHLRPRMQRSHGMRRQVGPAAVERQLAPAATERGPTAVAVLQIEQPLDARLSRAGHTTPHRWRQSRRTRPARTGQQRSRPYRRRPARLPTDRSIPIRPGPLR